jgi:hypothetical protein
MPDEDALDLILRCIDPTEYRAVSTQPAIDQLRAEGPSGSDRLAPLIQEFVESRSEGVIYALQVARHLEMTPALENAVSGVIAASPVTSGVQGRFSPEISGGGQIGWTDQTHSRAVELANEALAGSS